jgi:23S rRNA (pseudouridine1915-N3)-methyltransferase
MQIRVLLVGKMRERFLLEGVREYSSRLAPYCSLTMVEIPDIPVPPDARPAMEGMAVADEGKAIQARLNREEYVIALDEGGVCMSSTEFSRLLADLGLFGKSKVAFVVGGHSGLSPEVKKRADVVLSLSRMTFPHQMVPLILLEQVYRAMKIARNEPYHR